MAILYYQNRQSSNSLAANPAFSRSNLKSAPRMKPEVSWVATPFKSPPSARSTASAAAAQEQQQQQQQPNARRHKGNSSVHSTPPANSVPSDAPRKSLPLSQIGIDCRLIAYKGREREFTSAFLCKLHVHCSVQ